MNGPMNGPNEWTDEWTDEWIDESNGRPLAKVDESLKDRVIRDLVLLSTVGGGGVVHVHVSHACSLCGPRVNRVFAARLKRRRLSAGGGTRIFLPCTVSCVWWRERRAFETGDELKAYMINVRWRELCFNPWSE